MRSPYHEWCAQVRATRHTARPLMTDARYRMFTMQHNPYIYGFHGESGLTMTNRYFVCPTLNYEFEFDVRNGSYGYNYQYLGNSHISSSEQRWDNFPVGLGRVCSASQTVLLADSRGGGARQGKHSYAFYPPRLAVERFATKFGPDSSDVSPGVDDESLYMYSPVEMRHGKRGNVVFLDAHAKAMMLEDLGYQVNEEGEAMPILDPMNDTCTASNKLWNGEAYDKIAIKHRP